MSLYRKLPLAQGTPEWLKARREHVTASDVAPILGIEGYRDIDDVIRDKIHGERQDEGKSYVFEMGHKAEHAAREWVRANLGYELKPVCLESIPHPHLMASLDGLNEIRRLNFEAKYMGKAALEDVRNGKIKPSHNAQVQAQLLISGAEKCLYFAMDPDGNAEVIPIYPDAELQKQIIMATAKFYADLKAGKLYAKPKEISIPGDTRFERLAEFKRQAEDFKMRFDSLKAELEQTYQNTPTIRTAGLVITRQKSGSWVVKFDTKGKV